MQIDVTEPRTGASVLTLEGRLNMVSAPQLKTAITEAVEAGRTHVVVDLAGVGFMDSSGLGVLIAGLKRARQDGGDLRITGVTQQVATVLQLTNLDRVLHSYSDVGEALDGW
ncbi:anti-sigma factor antagonist BldG [soil metagenome]